MKCPYCNKKDFIPEVAYTYTETYGGGTHNVACVHCRKIVTVSMRRVVKVDAENIRKADKGETADWSDMQMFRD